MNNSLLEEVIVNLSSNEIGALEPTLKIEVEESDIYPKYHEVLSKIFLKLLALKSTLSRDLKLDIEEATALKYVLEEFIWTLKQEKNRTREEDIQLMLQEDIQLFANIRAKLPEFISTLEMRQVLLREERRELTKAEEEA